MTTNQNDRRINNISDLILDENWNAIDDSQDKGSF